MAYAVVPTAVTGDIVPAAYGNRLRDNLAYLKGQAGSIALENSVAVSGAVSATGTISTPAIIQTGPGAGAAFQFADRANGTLLWAWYANAGVAYLFNSVLGNLFGLDYATGNGSATAHLGLYSNALSQSALTGFLRAGTWTYAYNGDGTIASQVMNAAGPLSGWAITYEYSAGLVGAMRLRIGGAAGTIVQSINFTYDGSGRISTESHG
jgi:hypothetical protein